MDLDKALEKMGLEEKWVKPLKTNLKDAQCVYVRGENKVTCLVDKKRLDITPKNGKFTEIVR